jgi:integrase/recombinase XerD
MNILKPIEQFSATGAPFAPEKSQYERVGEITCIYLRGNTWWVNYQHNGQHRKSLKTKSKKEARLRALRLERDVLTGHFRPDAKPPLITDAAAAFRDAKVGQGIATSTLRKYDHCIALLKQVAYESGLKRISQITPAFMDRFRKRRVEALAKRPGRDGQKTAANDLVTIREIVNYALKRKLIHEDPLAGYSIKKVKTKMQPYWPQPELDQILAAAFRQPHGDLFKLLALTGMRVGEAQFLTWDDLDFENRIIKIQAKPGWRPKTCDARSVPMMEDVDQLLRRQPQRGDWVFTFPADCRGAARQVRQRRLLDYLKRVLKKLSLKGHLHTFRHSFISLALARGTPESKVRAWVGHVDPEIMKRYTHIADSESHEAMRQLEQSIKDKRGSSAPERS